LSETLIGTFDTTNALEVLFDVRTFNNMIGIVKDTNNIGVLSSDYYDISNDMLYKDSLTLNAADFVTALVGSPATRHSALPDAAQLGHEAGRKAKGNFRRADAR